MINSDILYYAFCVVALAVGFIIVKKVASCLIKTVVMLAIVAILVFIYFNYFA